MLQHDQNKQLKVGCRWSKHYQNKQMKARRVMMVAPPYMIIKRWLKIEVEIGRPSTVAGYFGNFGHFEQWDTDSSTNIHWLEWK